MKKYTVVSIIHYVRLIYRSAIFLFLLMAYISFRFNSGSEITSIIESRPLILGILWAVFVVEMTMRFFPFSFESPGCQKQFRRNYIKTGRTEILIQDNNSVILVLLVWDVFNLSLGALHMSGILDDGIMILLCSFYSICDIICILFFCPFQSWLMKNRCCVNCRIYNWDYAMMFTPLFFVKKIYSWSLLALSVALLIRWEITFFRHPERFSENTNAYLRCSNCSEKLCAHKKQLQALWAHIENYTKGKQEKLEN